jgi:hypothetical protein
VSHAAALFESCVAAIRDGDLIVRDADKDKEFHFQNWFKRRLDAFGEHYESGGRNSYPDFRMVRSAEGYELKGLAYPGRDATYDGNSQVPRGEHNGRSLYYVFGRYPKRPDGSAYPVLDLVVCHGSFLNADNSYVHKNKSFRGFGSYGDIMVRDLKMYVAPTPFALAEGTAHRRTLILPVSETVGAGLFPVGTLIRREVDEVVGAYSFNLGTNELGITFVPNPNVGMEHVFRAYRVLGDPSDPVTLRSKEAVLQELDAVAARADAEDEEADHRPTTRKSHGNKRRRRGS